MHKTVKVKHLSSRGAIMDSTTWSAPLATSSTAAKAAYGNPNHSSSQFQFQSQSRTSSAVHDTLREVMGLKEDMVGAMVDKVTMVDRVVTTEYPVCHQLTRSSFMIIRKLCLCSTLKVWTKPWNSNNNNSATPCMASLETSKIIWKILE